MKLEISYNHFHMKTETFSERFWIELDDNTVSSKLLYLVKHFWTPQNVMLPHLHLAYELICIVEGEGSILSQGIEHKLSRGDILVVEPHVMHEAIAHPVNPIKLLAIGYDFNRDRMPIDPPIFSLDQDFLRFYEAYTTKTQLPVIHDQYHIENILFKLIDEVNERQLGRDEIIKAYLLQLFVLLIRNMARHIETEELSSMEREYCQRAKEFIRTHSHEPLTLKEISSHVCLSPSHFCRLFKDATAFTPIEYLIAIRIENAKRYLVHSDLALTEISRRVGFSSIHYFSRYFKKKEGVCPLGYRRDKRKLLSR